MFSARRHVPTSGRDRAERAPRSRRTTSAPSRSDRFPARVSDANASSSSRFARAMAAEPSSAHTRSNGTSSASASSRLSSAYRRPPRCCPPQARRRATEFASIRVPSATSRWSGVTRSVWNIPTVTSISRVASSELSLWFATSEGVRVSSRRRSACQHNRIVQRGRRVEATRGKDRRMSTVPTYSLSEVRISSAS
jgi:hypothetical protein